jgi:hypothetical protein
VKEFWEALAKRAGTDIEKVREVEDWLYQRNGGYDRHEWAIEEAEEYYRKRLERDARESFLVLPVYIYEHSRVGLSTLKEYPFNSRWDAGQVGWIYAEWGEVEDLPGGEEEDLKVLEAEVDRYGKYLSGDVVGYEIKDKEGNFQESGWGYYDVDRAIEEAKYMAEALAKA